MIRPPVLQISARITSSAVNLEVQGGNILVCTLKTQKPCSRQYCNWYCSTSYAQPGRIRRLSIPLSSWTIFLSLFSFVISRSFCLSHLSSLSARRRLVSENAPTPIMSQISSALTHFELRYFSFADVTGFRSPRPDSLTGITIRALTMGHRVPSLQGKDKEKVFLNNLLHSRKLKSCVSGDALHKYPLWLDCACCRGVILLWIFPCGFVDRANVLLPCQRTLSQPISIGTVSPYLTPKITCACEQFTYVTHSEHFFGLDIIWMNDQYAFGKSRTISASWLLVF